MKYISLRSLPMAPGARSLSLATVVCASVYKGLRQLAGGVEA